MKGRVTVGAIFGSEDTITEVWSNIYPDNTGHPQIAGVPTDKRENGDVGVGWRIHVIPKTNPRCEEIWT